MHLLEVRNPVAQQRGVIDSIKTNPRPETLDGKTVGLLWSGTHGGDIALKTAARLIQERFKDVKVNLYNGSGYPAPDDVRNKCIEESDVVIGATAD